MLRFPWWTNGAARALRMLSRSNASLTRRERGRLRQEWPPTNGARTAVRAQSVSIPRLRVAAGVHPIMRRTGTPRLESRLYAMLADRRTCALGEVGLDYHYDLSPRAVQRDVFRRQISMAHECGVPLILHMRDAHDDGFAILEEGWPAAGCFCIAAASGPDRACPAGSERAAMWRSAAR